jgi:hypothetical protein
MPIVFSNALCFFVLVIFTGCANHTVKDRKITDQYDSDRHIHSIDSTPAYLNHPDTSTNPHYLEALRFLATIRKVDVQEKGLDAYFKQFPGYAIDSFLSYFSKTRFVISDMEKGDSDSEYYSTEELKKELLHRKGPAFDILAQMGYIYSTPYPQYSGTDFKIRPDSMGIDVNMAGNYLLSFTKENGSGAYRLSRVESDHIGDQ